MIEGKECQVCGDEIPMFAVPICTPCAHRAINGLNQSYHQHLDAVRQVLREKAANSYKAGRCA